MKTADRILALLRLAGPTGLTSSAMLEISGMWSGTAYVVLARLEKQEMIVSDWDDEPAPRHRRYWLAQFKQMS